MSSKNYYPSSKKATPFNPTLDHFDMICGQVMKENRILKIVTICACISFVLSIAITLYAVSLPDSIPVLVTLNDFGEPQYIGEVSKKNYQNYSVPEIAVKYQVKQFVSLYYTLSTDRGVMDKNVKKMNHMLTNQTSSKYSIMVKEEKLFDGFGSIMREVVFETEPMKVSNNTFQVDFHLITRSMSGSNLVEEKKRALVTTDCMIPSKDDVYENPLGIYVTSFEITSINSEIRR